MFPLKSIDTQNNQSFPTDLRKVVAACYLAHYPVVSSAKKVPARFSDFSRKMTYSLSILTHCHSVLIECIAIFYVNVELFIDAWGPNVFEDMMSANCAFNSERSRHTPSGGGLIGWIVCSVGLFSNKTV